MQNTQDNVEGHLNKDLFYRKVRFAGGAKSRSMALTLPKEFLDDLDIQVADHVVIYKEEKQIIIRKA